MQPVLPVDHQVPFVQIISLHWHLKIAHLENHQSYYFRVTTLKFSCFYIQPQLLKHIPFFTSQIKTPTRAILMLVIWVEALWKDLPLVVLPQHFWKQDCRRKTSLQALVSKCHLSVKSNPNLPLYSSDPLPNLSWRWPWPFHRDFKFWLPPAPFCFSRLGTGVHTLKELVTGGDLEAL